MVPETRGLRVNPNQFQPSFLAWVRAALGPCFCVRFSEFRAAFRTSEEPNEQRPTFRFCRLHLPGFNGFTDFVTALWTFWQSEHTSQNKIRCTNVLTSSFFFVDLQCMEVIHVRVAWDSDIFEIAYLRQESLKRKDSEEKAAERLR
jgi:hypothetical protein